MGSEWMRAAALAAVVLLASGPALAQSDPSTGTRPDGGASGPVTRETDLIPSPDHPVRPDIEHTAEEIAPVVTTAAPTEISPACEQEGDSGLRIEGCSEIIAHPGTEDWLLSEAYHKRGLAHHNISNFEAAVSDFDSALELSPDDPVILNNRGNSHALSGDLRKAIADHTRAIELAPNMQTAWNNRAADYLDQNDPVSAISDLDQALSLDPLYRDARVNRLFVRCRLGLMGATLDDIELAMQLEDIDVDQIIGLLTSAGRHNGVADAAVDDADGMRVRVKAYCRGGDAGIEPRVDGRPVLQPRRGAGPSEAMPEGGGTDGE
ncbi:MAG: tetratricopeptide repeat protein [Pseudomonadota bacterium]